MGLPYLDSSVPFDYDNAPTVQVVEVCESGPGTDSDVRFLAVFADLERALAYCQGEGREQYLVRPQLGTVAAFAVTETYLDHHGWRKRHYVAYDGSLHQEWPYQGSGLEAKLRPQPEHGAGLVL
jgi:hypothetical protein